MAIVECTFNSVNGQNTGCNARTGKGNSYPSVGTLVKKNTPGGKGSFSVDTSDAKDGWYKLVDPSKYNLSASKTVYVKLQQSYIKTPDISKLNKDTENNNNPSRSTSTTTKDYALTGTNTKDTSNGLDNEIQSMLSQQFDVAKLNRDSKVMGAPFNFLASADYRPIDTDTGKSMNLGRQYMENILLEAPIVNIVPGIPSYMQGMNQDEKNAIDNYIKARYNNEQISSDVTEQTLGSDHRYFDFVPAYAQYIQYVNLLCRSCAIYMGIDQRHVPNTNKKYSEYDWGRWTNINYTSKNPEQGIFDKALDRFTDEVLGEYRYVKCYVDPGASFSESISNNTGQSQVASLFDQMESIMREVSFFSNGGDIGSALVNFGASSVNDISSAIQSALSNGASTGLSRIIGSANHVLSGSNIIFPELWTDSSTSKSYSFTVNLVSPYGDDESIFLNVIMPMMHLIALAMPRQTSANSFGSPFLVKMFAKGIVSCDLGIVNSITIEKGGDGTGWTVSGLPTEVKISMSITDLYTNLMMTRSSEPTLFVNNDGILDFLATTCGVDLTIPNYKKKLAVIISAYTNSVFDMPSNIYDQSIQSLRNILEPYIRLGRF